MPNDKTRFGLDETSIPEAWYNIIPDLKTPPAPPRVITPDGTELGPDQIGEVLASLFPMECLKQEMSADRYIDIPGAVIDVYKTYRPSPLLRARQLEQDLGLPAGVSIYYKYEGVSPGRVAQAQHRHPAGLLQQAGGHHEDLHRDRRRPVGQRAGHRRRAVRHRRRGLSWSR